MDASETGLIERAQAAFTQVQTSLSAEESEVALGEAPKKSWRSISTSKTRRRMYEEGRWTPTIQCSIYTREEFIAWAESLGLLR